MSSTFKYVLIPYDESSSIVTLDADKSGGLSDDHLQTNAKEYFWKQNGKGASAELDALDNASPEVRRAFAQQVRSQSTKHSSPDAMANIDDDTIINMVKTAQGTPTCEIIALTIPTPTNNYHSVSIYASPSQDSNLPPNPRATALLTACGHNRTLTNNPLRGDVFVGRCVDNEVGDVWTRVDFTEADVDPESEWCRVARGEGGGGGRGGDAASSSGLLSNMGGRRGGGGGDGGTERVEEGYTWVQTGDEVELKVTLDGTTGARDVKIKFAGMALSVVVAGTTILEGATGGSVVVDECTYTIESVGGGKKELCVTLAKRDEGVTWPFAIKR